MAQHSWDLGEEDTGQLSHGACLQEASWASGKTHSPSGNAEECQQVLRAPLHISTWDTSHLTLAKLLQVDSLFFFLIN